MNHQEKELLITIAKVTQYAARKSAVTILNNGFLPPKTAEERLLERWMKISLAHLCDNILESMVTPIILMSVRVAEIFPNTSSQSIQPIIHALIGSDDLEKMKSETHFTKKSFDFQLYSTI